MGTVERLGLGSHGQGGGWTGFEQLTGAGAEPAYEVGAADLEQEIGAAAGPAHLLRFAQPKVDEGFVRVFRQRGADPQTSVVVLGIVDHSTGLFVQARSDVDVRID